MMRPLARRRSDARGTIPRRRRRQVVGTFHKQEHKGSPGGAAEQAALSGRGKRPRGTGGPTRAPRAISRGAGSRRGGLVISLVGGVRSRIAESSPRGRRAGLGRLLLFNELADSSLVRVRLRDELEHDAHQRPDGGQRELPIHGEQGGTARGARRSRSTASNTRSAKSGVARPGRAHLRANHVPLPVGREQRTRRLCAEEPSLRGIRRARQDFRQLEHRKTVEFREDVGIP